jgi:hypothetical protein
MFQMFNALEGQKDRQDWGFFCGGPAHNGPRKEVFKNGKIQREELSGQALSGKSLL